MVVLPFAPVPLMRPRSTPSSLASLRTPGEAKTPSPTFDSSGLSMGIGSGSSSGSGSGSLVTCDSSLFETEPVSLVSILNKRSFVDTSSPSLINTSVILPLWSDGISIEALSDSNTKRTSSLLI